MKRFAILLALLCASTAHAATWHVDSERGNDDASGLAPDQAWRTLGSLLRAHLQPGDTVLLADGSVWREPLLLIHSGAESAPITVTRSGQGARPRIEAGGVAENAVEIRNADNIVLSGLEVTNTGPGSSLRRGVFVNAIDHGVASNIILRDLYIHDVNGNND
ncbi:MAG: xylose ABC transporter, partial [Sphingomonadales bacterium]|nr:xylose ABC transporter [Sphingomonadales bacterium]